MNNSELTVEMFISKIVEEFPDIEREKITADMKFRDHLEWDSINALILIAMVNVEYDVTINAEELINAQTIRDVFKVIETKIEK